MAVTFDTLKFVDTLEQAHVPRDQARAIAAAVSDAYDATDIATKGDIALVRKDMDLLRKDMDLLRKDFDNLRWTLRLVLGGIVVLILKAFF